MQRQILIALLLPLAACQDVPVEPETPDTGPVNMSVVAATTEFVKCGEEIPVTVTATDSRGRPLVNYLVNFKVLAGGGRMFAGTALTNRSGIARDYWSIGSAANVLNTLEVRAVDPTTGAKNTYFTQTVTTLSKIAFTSNRDGNYEIYTMYPDGSNLTRLTNNPAQDFVPAWSRNITPAWSPDGSQIAFVSDRDGYYSMGNYEIYVMNADGSGQIRLTNDSAWDGHPTWSPDGSQIAFTSWRDGKPQIYVMNADGTGLQRLTNLARDWEPAWSPDGSQIAFESNRDGNGEIYVMNADGSGQKRLTYIEGSDHWPPTWSPDSTRIAFTSDGADEVGDIYAMNADGSGLTRLTDDPAEDSFPAWQP